MLKLEALIKKFWSGTIRHSELKELEKLLQQRSRIGASAVVEQEVDEESVPNSLDRKRADELLKKIHTNISETGVGESSHALKKKSILFRPGFTGIAASITLAILLTCLWMRKEEPEQIKNKMQQASVIVHLHTENKTDTIMNISLPDSSIAMLYPQSSINYDMPFINNKREIKLTGAAEFKVNADRSKPFTVYANGIATTALGTRFRVNAKGKKIHILLYEGKVVIHPVMDGHLKEAYLHPGEQLYAAKDFNYIISRIQPETVLLAATKEKKIPHTESNADPIHLKFSNTPLSDVFDMLAKHFQIHIVYTDREKLQEIPFTGYFSANDSLENLLKMLCGMNNLQYELTGDELKISNP